MGVALADLRATVLEFARRVGALGLAPNTQGNLSARDPASGLIAITAHDLAYDLMTPDDVVIVDPDGRVIEGSREPSHETAVHCAVYRERPEIHGIVHSEPVYANCFGCLGQPIAPVVISLLLAAGGEVPVMPFMPSGSAGFGREMLRQLGDRRAIIWANHGLLTVGRSLDEAFRCTVAVEEGAKVYHLALQLSHLGPPVALPPDLFRAAIG